MLSHNIQADLNCDDLLNPFLFCPTLTLYAPNIPNDRTFEEHSGTPWKTQKKGGEKG